MQQEKKITLRNPVTVAGRVTTEITIRPIKAKHLRGIRIGYSEIETDVLLELIAKCTGELPAVIDELSLEDLAEIGNAVMDFLPHGLRPGGRAPLET